MTRGHVHNAIGNTIGRANANSILDTKMYQVEFAGNDIIAESI